MENNSDGSDISTKPRLKTWKQWFLIYPTFAIAVLGAIPQYIDVIKGLVIGVDANQVSYAENQHRLWVKNQDCHPELHTIKTVENSDVSVGACPTGDIQINIKYPDNSKVVRWYGFDELKNMSSNNNGLYELLGIRTAVAEVTIHSELQLLSLENQVICQEFLGKGKLVRIIRDGDECYREIINTYTGEVEERKPVECSTACSAS